MSADQMLVLAAGIAAILWINWYFFVAGRGDGVRAGNSGGVQTVEVLVEGGYEPAVIRATAGTPLRLAFNRQETSSCSEEVVIPEFGVRRFLPAFETTEVEIVPVDPGEYEFTCGMGMLRGRLVVEEE